MNTAYTVLLTDGTVGTIEGQSAYDFIGAEVSVNLHDENGNNIQVRGELSEVLSVD